MKTRSIILPSVKVDKELEQTTCKEARKTNETPLCQMLFPPPFPLHTQGQIAPDDP